MAVDRTRKVTPYDPKEAFADSKNREARHLTPYWCHRGTHITFGCHRKSGHL